MNSPFPSRRDFLRNTLNGFGYAAFAGLSTQAAMRRGGLHEPLTRQLAEA